MAPPTGEGLRRCSRSGLPVFWGHSPDVRQPPDPEGRAAFLRLHDEFRRFSSPGPYTQPTPIRNRDRKERSTTALPLGSPPLSLRPTRKPYTQLRVRFPRPNQGMVLCPTVGRPAVRRLDGFNTRTQTPLRGMARPLSAPSRTPFHHPTQRILHANLESKVAGSSPARERELRGSSAGRASVENRTRGSFTRVARFLPPTSFGASHRLGPTRPIPACHAGSFWNNDPLRPSHSEAHPSSQRGTAAGCRAPSPTAPARGRANNSGPTLHRLLRVQPPKPYTQPMRVRFPSTAPRSWPNGKGISF